jgi:DNA polymerase-1
MDNSGNYWNPSHEMQIWRELARIIENMSIEKIAQNGMFDFMFLFRTNGIKVRNFAFDTMIAQHICWTDLPKGLDFLNSIYNYIRYYKDEGKLSHLKAIKDWPTYWHYNAMDSISAHQCRPPLEKELDKLTNARDIFNYSMQLHKPLMEMEYRGILTDSDGIAQKRAELQQECETLQAEVNALVGRPLNPRSSQQLQKYFYVEQSYRPYTDRKTGRPTCNERALVGLARKGSEVAQKIRTLRKTENLISKYFTTVVDDDHRLRCTYKICGSKYGRLSSEGTYIGTGTNLQNQTPIFKQYLMADPGHILIEPDLAKAEAHVVAYLCQDANMMEAFESNVDVHTYNAHKIFNVPMSEVTKHQRKMGKRVVHASNYGMGPQTFSDQLAVDDIFIGRNECRELLDAYARRFPGLHRWHKEIEDEVYRTRILYNLFGRPKRFLGKIDTTLLMSAYSYKPQSTVAGLLNRGMNKMANDPRLLVLDDDGQINFQFLATVHDSILYQMPITFASQLPDMLSIIKDHLTHTFTYRGRSFTIGVDAKIGYNWGKDMIELKDFGSESVYNALEQLGIQV